MDSFEAGASHERNSTRHPLAARAFHLISVKDYTWKPDDGVRSPDWYEQSAQRFLGRLEGHADFRGKTVLDIGCGFGEMAAILARDGAARVVGIDINVPAGADAALVERYGDEALQRVELVETAGDLHELGDEQFDVVLSKESMEHYPDPETFVPLIASRVRPGGILVIGFGPLWKAFDGGHIRYMTKVPWAHLIFPENVIMAERRRFRPEENATRFSEIRGGLNKITLRRFEAIISSTGFEPVFVKYNAGDHPAVAAMDKLAKIPPLREYFTRNVYGVWAKPVAPS